MNQMVWCGGELTNARRVGEGSSPLAARSCKDKIRHVTHNKAPPVGDAERLQLIDAIVDYAIYMIDPKGMVASWNPGAERLKGYTAAEIIGKLRHFLLP